MASPSYNSLPVKRMAGIVNGGCFSVHPDGSTAFFYEYRKGHHTKLILATGDQISIEASRISKKEDGEFSDQITVFRNPKYFNCGMIVEISENKLVLYTYNFENVGSGAIAYNNVYLHMSHNSSEEFIQDSEGKIYCLSYWWSGGQTFFSTAQIVIDETGAVQSTPIASKRSLNGMWGVPFIHKDCCYWLSFNSTSYLKRLLRVPFYYENGRHWPQGEKIDIMMHLNFFPDSPSWRFTHSKTIDSFIFYYTYEEHSDKYLLFCIDLRKKCARQVPFHMHNHIINSRVNMEVRSAGFLYLHGNCGCDQAHLYTIDIKNVINPPRASGISSLITTDPTSVKKNRSSSHHEPSVPIQKEITRWTPTKYVKKEQLGRGAFGVVHKCFDMDAQKFFVAKETTSLTEEVIGAAINEISRLNDMKHPRIIDYYGFKVKESAIVIFMEYMAAGSLRYIINDYGPIKEAASIKYIKQILGGLVYIHEMGVIHCDLKCDNILNDGQGNVKLGDFGIAVQKRINSANQSYFSHEPIGGALYWRAPEVMNGDGCRRKSDIWSLGCTIVEMLTGEPPYGKMTPPGFMCAMYNKSLSYHPDVLVPCSSKKMKAFLSQLLQFEIDERRTAVEAITVFENIRFYYEF